MQGSSPGPDEVYPTYSDQLKRRLPECHPVAFLNPNGTVCWTEMDASVLDDRVLDRLRVSATLGDLEPRLINLSGDLATLPIPGGETAIGAVLVPLPTRDGESAPDALTRTWHELRPLLESLGQDLIESRRPQSKAAVLTERTEELEWLYGVTAELHTGSSDTPAIQSLLAASVERMNSAFGSLIIPARQLHLTYASRILLDDGAARTHQYLAQNLMSHMQHSAAPLVLNHPARTPPGVPVRKVLALPIKKMNGKLAGVLVFYKQASLPDFGRRQLYLGRHIARQMEMLLNTRHDLATGLLTRVAVEKDATQLISARPEDPHCVVCIDVDHLQIVNETFGFDIGDEAILRIANLLQAPNLPDDAIPGRLAGDDFVVFLPGCDTITALQYIQEVQEQVNRITVGLLPSRITMSVSCGIARLPNATGGFRKGLAAAELACRTAKERGRNRTEVYLDVDDSMMHRHGDILSAVRVRAALDKDRLQVYTQKIVSLRDVTRTHGLECLVRLVAEDGQIVAPADFLSAANRYQLTRTVDEWVIDHVLDTIKPRRSTLFHGGIYVSVNVSEQSLNDDAFVRSLENRIVRSEVAPGLIMFELAEGIVARNRESAAAFRRRVQRLGCRFGVDNFGTRPQSLALLQELRPDRVKIDKQLVRDVLGDMSAEALVRTIARMAEGSEVDCIAEYAESPALVRRLRELGVGYAQGNSLHEAEPLTAVLNALHNEESQQLERLYREQ